VPPGVGERLLHGAVRGDVGERRERGRDAGRALLDLGASRAGGRDELRQVGEAGHGGGARLAALAVGALAEDPDDGAQRVERLAALEADPAEGVLGALRVQVDQALGGAGLHDERRQVVRRHVVQLAGHAGALGGDRGPAEGGLVLEALGGPREHVAVVAAAERDPGPDGRARGGDEQAADEDRRGRDDRVDAEPRVHGRGHEQPADLAGGRQVRADGLEADGRGHDAHRGRRRQESPDRVGRDDGRRGPEPEVRREHRDERALEEGDRQERRPRVAAAERERRALRDREDRDGRALRRGHAARGAVRPDERGEHPEEQHREDRPGRRGGRVPARVRADADAAEGGADPLGERPAGTDGDAGGRLGGVGRGRGHAPSMAGGPAAAVAGAVARVGAHQ
jgi:hypothetical protein